MQNISDDASRDQLSMVSILSVVYALDHLKARLPGPRLFRAVRLLVNLTLIMIEFQVEIFP
jgi:hypothetical protein